MQYFDNNGKEIKAGMKILIDEHIAIFWRLDESQNRQKDEILIWLYKFSKEYGIIGSINKNLKRKGASPQLVHDAEYIVRNNARFRNILPLPSQKCYENKRVMHEEPAGACPLNSNLSNR